MKNLFSLILAFTILLLTPTLSILAYETAPSSKPFESSSSAAIEYTLPYPGMLPDNSLYVFKVLRDKLMLLVMTDPHKKAQYHLLLANKQILMSNLLVEKGNIPLAKEIALKGENQMTLMTFVYKNAGLTPKPEFLAEVRLATLKHQEILKEIIRKVSDEDAAIFSTVMEFSQRNIDQLDALAEKNE